MSGDLRELEREVEAARARLTGDLTVLRSPDTFSEFTENLKQAALDTKNSIVEDARTRTRSAVDDVVENLKARAAANPTAVLLIGAGLAWHLLRRPPIVAALVGGGLYSLFRTQPQYASYGSDRGYMEEAKANLKQQARDVARAAGDTGMQAAEAARHKAAEVAEAAVAAGRHAADVAMHKAAEFKETASDVGRQAVETMRNKAAGLTGSNGNGHYARERNGSGYQSRRMQGGEPYYDEFGRAYYPEETSDGGLPMDRLLLGAAGVAVVAAVALAYQRGGEEPRDTVDY